MDEKLDYWGAENHYTEPDVSKKRIGKTKEKVFGITIGNWNAIWNTSDGSMTAFNGRKKIKISFNASKEEREAFITQCEHWAAEGREGKRVSKYETHDKIDKLGD